MLVNAKDRVFENSDLGSGNFSFDDKVAEVFSDMANRSIPGYRVIIETIAKIAAKKATDNSIIYDLGCSLGAATIAMRRSIDSNRKVKIKAIDNSEAMVSRCRSIVSSYCSHIPVEIIVGDIVDTKIENASVVVLNFVMQFIDPNKRNIILKNIYDGLNPGGVLILSEKLHQNDNVLEDFLTDLYLDFKRDNGYSELEISRKRTALENVLIPDTYLDLQSRFEKAGFTHFERWFQTYNFCSCIAIK